MKILFVEFYLPYLLKDAEFPAGGWTNELSAWLEGLHHCDCKVGVLTWKGAREFVGTDQDLGFDLLETYKPHTGIKILRYFYVYIPALMKATKQFQPDVIIQSSSGIETGIMAFIAKRLHIPFVHRVASDRDADDRINKAPIPFYAKSAFRYGLHNTSATICQNQYQQHALTKRYPDKKHYILHNPFASVDRLPCKQDCIKKDYIAWVGIFKHEKNLPLLYQIAKQLPELTFKVAGMKGKHADGATEHAVEKLQTLQNVQLIGFVKRKDIFLFLCNAAVLLSTSHYEGFSNVLLEAMAVGTPVVLPSRVDPDNIIAENKLGLAADSDEELPRYLQKIMTMPPKHYQKLSECCRSFIKEHHDPARKARTMLTLLEDIVSSAPTRQSQ